MKEPNIIMLLISAIVSLSGCVVWLALYIRSLQTKSVEMSIKFTECTIKLENSITSNTEAIEKNIRSLDDLHKLILSSLISRNKN